ncbi:lipocalin-like domain-containing protein [Nostoc sp. MG11]|uniref:lipocalin-like domain-containing protein n=1 Tax=Nostoc sp. MG11 TaxID=2721166 RepID=UPI001865E545|nr:lipocalin-like domain-containing protein [Nostoc sp. MG11]
MIQSVVSENDLVGTWKLIDFKSIDSEKIDYPFGKSPVGYIIYTQDGYMCASIMTSDRLNLEMSIAEMQEFRNVALKPQLIVDILKYIKAILRYFQAARNYISYSGKYEIIDNRVIHHVEVSLVPDWTGTDLERTVEFSGDKLVLISPLAGNVSFHLTWQRV